MYSSLLEQLPDHCLELILDKLTLSDFDNFIVCCKRLNEIGKGVREMRAIRLHDVVKQTRAAKWRLLHSGESGDRSYMTPGLRFGSSLIHIDNSIYLFGGATVNWTTFNDLWRFDLRERHWTRRIPGGTCPPPRAAATAILLSDGVLFGSGSSTSSGISFIIIGGFELTFSIHAKRSSNWDNSPWIYNLQSNRWSMMPVDCSQLKQPIENQLDTSASGSSDGLSFHVSPTPVGQSYCLLMHDQIIMFGGAAALLNQCQGLRRHSSIQPHSLSDHTFSLSISTGTITRIRTFRDVAPPKRCGHSAVAIDANCMVILGGYLGPNTKGSEDMWMLSRVESASQMCHCVNPSDMNVSSSANSTRDSSGGCGGTIWYWTELRVDQSLQPLCQFMRSAVILPRVNARPSVLVILGGASTAVEDSLFRHNPQGASPFIEPHRANNTSKEEITFKRDFRSLKKTNQIIIHSIDLSSLTTTCDTCGLCSTRSNSSIKWIAPLAELQDLGNAPNIRQGFSLVAGHSSIFLFGGLMYKSIFTRPIYLLNDLMIRDDETEDVFLKACSDLHELTYRTSAILL